jgi:hypothetical protein
VKKFPVDTSIVKCVRRISAARYNPVSIAIDNLLTADVFDEATVEWLAHRERYAEAVRTILRIVRSDFFTHFVTIVPVLLDEFRPLVTPFRALVAFGARSCHASQRLQITLDDLKRFAQSPPKKSAARAAAALTALGFPVRNWPDMPRRERACYALGALVRTHRDGVS